MAWIETPLMIPLATIDPDPTIVTDPYFAMRNVGKDGSVVSRALRFRCIVWRLAFSGHYTVEIDLGGGDVLEFSCTFSNYIDVTLVVPSNESFFARPLPGDAPNDVMHVDGPMESLTTPVGTWTKKLNGVTTDSGNMVVCPPGIGVDTNFAINTQFGYDPSTGLFGTIFDPKLVLVPVTLIGPDPTDFTVSIGTTPDPLAERQDDMPISVPKWDGGISTELVSVYASGTLMNGPDTISHSLEVTTSFLPYLQADGPHDFTEGLVFPWGDSDDPDDDSRIWNQDATAHRNPFTRELL